MTVAIDGPASPPMLGVNRSPGLRAEGGRSAAGGAVGFAWACYSTLTVMVAGILRRRRCSRLALAE